MRFLTWRRSRVPQHRNALPQRPLRCSIHKPIRFRRFSGLDMWRVAAIIAAADMMFTIKY
jgi:hypothetical protein